MDQTQGLKLFVSYSHTDEDLVKNFIRHIAPLQSNGEISKWYDRQIVPGLEFQDTIDNNLENADIICLFISASFLSSPSCLKEKRNALDLQRKMGVSVVPIILSHCGWLDDNEICNLLALPTDGRPVTDFENQDKAWLAVYEGIKRVVGWIEKNQELKVKKSFEVFLNDAELLSKAHPNKTEVLIDDIFIFPELIKFDNLLLSKEKKVNAEAVISNFYDYSKILFIGENQSGKTTLCKVIFKELFSKKYIPVYIQDRVNRYKGSIESKIIKAFKEQYENVDITEIDSRRIVPIIDDFQFAQSKEKILSNLEL